MSAQSVLEARRSLGAYAQSLRDLVAALDAGAELEHGKRVSDVAELRFETSKQTLDACSALERADLASELAEVRRWVAIAADRSTRAKNSVAERLQEIVRARQALAQLGGLPVGNSCDIAG